MQGGSPFAILMCLGGKAREGLVQSCVIVCGGCRSALGRSAGPKAPAHAQACGCLWARAHAEREWRLAQLPQWHLHCHVAPAAIPLQPYGCPGAPSCSGLCVNVRVPNMQSQTSYDIVQKVGRGMCLRIPGWHVHSCHLVGVVPSAIVMSSTADALAGAGLAATCQPQPARAVCAASCLCGADR